MGKTLVLGTALLAVVVGIVCIALFTSDGKAIIQGIDDDIKKNTPVTHDINKVKVQVDALAEAAQAAKGDIKKIDLEIGANEKAIEQHKVSLGKINREILAAQKVWEANAGKKEIVVRGRKYTSDQVRQQVTVLIAKQKNTMDLVSKLQQHTTRLITRRTELVSEISSAETRIQGYNNAITIAKLDAEAAEWKSMEEEVINRFGVRVNKIDAALADIQTKTAMNVPVKNDDTDIQFTEEEDNFQAQLDQAAANVK